MAEVIYRELYYCTITGHNKFYELTIEYPWGPQNRYKVFGHFGKIGTEGCIKQYQDYLYRNQAEERLRKISYSKRAKGYILQDTPPILRSEKETPTAKEPESKVIPPPSSRIEAILQEKAWQQKAQF